MTCRFQKVHVVFDKSLEDLENCTSFVKSTCDLLNSTCEIKLLKLLARHKDDRLNRQEFWGLDVNIFRYHRYGMHSIVIIAIISLFLRQLEDNINIQE